MLASFIRHGLTGEELRSEALEQVIAGSDTTAAAIRGALLYLMTNPRVYLKLRNEIDEAVASGNAPSSDDEIVSYSQTKQLPYLQAVVREAVRVWPPVVSIFPRDVPSGGDVVTVDGKSVFLPEGTSIGYSGLAMQRNKAIYGEDVKSFRPERWFEEDCAKLTIMTKTNDLIFGHGKWQCLGKPVAMLEINKVIFEVS
jgi:cytochrome P450